MERQEALREIAALRHNLHINSRLRLEFLANISKLLRDYGISADDELLSSLILAVPEELWAKDPPMPPIAPMPPDAPAPPDAPTPEDEPSMPPVSPAEPDVVMPPVAPMPPEAAES
jgi:hypothetical protein